jgi:hypothetical protein
VIAIPGRNVARWCDTDPTPWQAFDQGALAGRRDWRFAQLGVRVAVDLVLGRSAPREQRLPPRPQHGRLDVAAMHIIRSPGRLLAGLHRLGAAGYTAN